MAFAAVEGVVGDEPASATYPLDRRTTGTINAVGARVFLYREPAGPGVPVFATNTARDQVLDLVPERDYMDGGHLLAPADDFAAGWLPWRTWIRKQTTPKHEVRRAGRLGARLHRPGLKERTTSAPSAA